jgi:hypothetical protein
LIRTQTTRRCAVRPPHCDGHRDRESYLPDQGRPDEADLCPYLHELSVGNHDEVTDDLSELRRARRKFADLAANALSPAATIRLIKQMAREL